MEIVTTFVNKLYAFHFSDNELDELERVFDEWENPLFLFDFFTQNKNDLKGEYTIEEAILKTKKEAKKFRNRLIELANSNPQRLNEFFANLNNTEYKITALQKQKAKQTWLRLYALKIQDEVNTLYVITGGMIKLTLFMEEKNHGKIEKAKINKCIDFLKNNGIYDTESFIEIFF